MNIFKSKRKQRTLAPKVVSVRSFAAAKISRLLSGWKMDGGFTACEVSSNLNLIRGRCREMAKDSAYFRRWLQLIAINVVGEGFTFKSTPHDPSGNLDSSAAKIIEQHWWRFCNARDVSGATYFDATGRKTAAEMDRLNAKTWARDGEFFVHIMRGANNPYGIAFRVLRPDLCDHTYNSSDTGRGTIIHCGVEMSKICLLYTSPSPRDS